MATTAIPLGSKRPLAIAVLLGGISLSGLADARSVSWDDIANDDLSTEDVSQLKMRSRGLYASLACIDATAPCCSSQRSLESS